MPQIVVLPHVELCPEGAVIEAPAGKSLCDALLEKLQQTNAGDDHHAIKALIGEVNRATEEFAARRMDQSIRRALAGRKLDEVSL